MAQMNEQQLRVWAVEQAIKLITAAPTTEPPDKVEQVADRLVAYVKGP